MEIKRGQKQYECFDIVVVGGGLAGVAAALAHRNGCDVREIQISQLHEKMNKYDCLY